MNVLNYHYIGLDRIQDLFVQFLLQLVANSWRITKKSDPVPQMVPYYFAGIYYAYHTKREVFYNTDSHLTSSTSYKICTGNEVTLSFYK